MDWNRAAHTIVGAVPTPIRRLSGEPSVLAPMPIAVDFRPRGENVPPKNRMPRYWGTMRVRGKNAALGSKHRCCASATGMPWKELSAGMDWLPNRHTRLLRVFRKTF